MKFSSVFKLTQTKRKFALIANLVLVLSSLTFTSISLAQNQETEKEERWFEIEVILFKLKSEDGLFAESWKDDHKLNLSENVVDFLQPFELLEETKELTDVEGTNDLGNINEENNDTQADVLLTDNPVNLTPETVDAELVNEYEQPFIRLPKELLQLTKESKAIERHSRYSLVEHFSWRQPVDSRANATKIRIAGGQDYSEGFEYNGEKKIEFEAVNQGLEETIDGEHGNLDAENADVEYLSLKNEINDESNNPSLNQVSEENVTVDSIENDETTLENSLPPEPKPLDWVPEIDGEIKLYIHRNYLHVDSNMVYRKPGEIAVDIFHLDEQPLGYSFSETTSDQPTTQQQSGISASIPFNSELPSVDNTNTRNPSLFNSTESNFNWEFDSDFLNKKADKLFTEKLFNYPMIQDRRVRSGELHYFDHPLIGMLVIIRPYELEVFEDEIMPIETEANETNSNQLSLNN